MAADLMGYQALAQEALRGVIRAALERAASPDGLPGDHHFYITFKTRAPGVQVPGHLLERYPSDMTVVIKRHYWDLVVEPERFHVSLSFDQRPERLSIPYGAIVQFVDPIVAFALSFVPTAPPLAPVEEPPAEEPAPLEGAATVLSLDKFRKK